MNETEVIAELRAHIARKYKTQSGAANAWGITPAFVSLVLNGHKSPTRRMLSDAGYEVVPSKTTYRKKKA